MVERKYSPQCRPFWDSFVQSQLISVVVPLILGLVINHFAGGGLWFFMVWGVLHTGNIHTNTKVWIDIFCSDDKYDGDKYVMDLFLKSVQLARSLYVMGAAFFVTRLVKGWIKN